MSVTPLLLSLTRATGVTLMEQRVGFLLKKDNIDKAGGYLGIITALIAYYCGLSELLTSDDLFTLPLGKYRTD